MSNVANDKIVDVDEAATDDQETEPTGPPEEPSSKAPAIDEPVQNRGLTGAEIWNLTNALLAWACTVSNVTLVVGTSAVILIDIGGDTNLTSLPLGTFFFGSSIVSLAVTPWLFVQWGRTYGFLLGVGLGLVGTCLGLACIAAQSPALLTLSMIFFGMAMGVGFFLRFAAMELVPPHWRAKAATLVVTGGVIAAFAGPESAQGMKDALDKEWMGVFLMTGIFNVCNAIFTLLISFPDQSVLLNPKPSISLKTGDDETRLHNHKEQDRIAFRQILKSRQFLVPMLVASLTWSAMSMPMSIVRVVMGQVGYTARQSLTTIEIHFVGMYAPGFITGTLIQKFGPQWNVLAGVLIFFVGLVFNFLAKEDNNGSVAIWMLGLFLVGVAWNFCFTAATIWTTALYKKMPRLKPRVQAANDASMFLFGGAWLVSSSFIFEKGGSGLEGWDVLNGVVVGLVALMGLLVVWDAVLAKRETTAIKTSMQAAVTEEKVVVDA